MVSRSTLGLAVSVALSATMGFGESLAATEAATGPRESGPTAPRRIESVHLPNLIRVHDRVLSGGLPEGDPAFAELRALGIKTVISVDGMAPDVTGARRHGLRYVHLPHGYNGVPARRVQELAKALTECEGPFYIHCHHGRHRSPAAASVACVAAGLLPESAGAAILELAGTSPHYRGLFSAARNARRIDPALLTAMRSEFPESADAPPMVEAMVAMGRTIERLERMAEAGWRPPPNHPDLDPAHEALLLREHFTELLRADCVRQQPEGFVRLLRESEHSAEALEDALREAMTKMATIEPTEPAAALFARVRADCRACHQEFRDTPLGGR